MSEDIMSEDDLAELEAMMNETEAVAEEKQEVETEAKEAETKETESKVASEPKPKTTRSPRAKTKTADKEELLDVTEFKRDLAFSENSINDAFMNQASLYIHYASIAHRLAHIYDSEKSQLEILESQIDNDIRTEAAQSKTKITEAALTKQVKLDSRYAAKVERMHEAKMKASLAKDVLESFKQRRDMLIQMGADLREEMKGDLRMKALEGERSSKVDNARKIVGR